MNIINLINHFLRFLNFVRGRCRIICAIRTGRVVALGSRQVNDGISGFLRFQSGVWGRTACHRIKFGAVNQVLEVLPRIEQDVHRFDVLGGKLFERGCSNAAERETECSKLPEHNFIPAQELFDQTLAGIGQDTFHRATAVNAVMVGNVTGEPVNLQISFTWAFA